jgi:hypothetical protein
MRQRYGTSSHFREFPREEGVDESLPSRFINMFILIMQAITNIFYVKMNSWNNIGTKFADFVRHNLRLKTSFQILFGGHLIYCNGKQS